MPIPIHDLWWIAAGGSAGYGARFMKHRIDAVLNARRRKRLPDPTGELLRLQTLYGYNAHALVSIAPGALSWSSPEIDGAIIYGEFGRVWLAAGDPLTALPDRAELARQFAADARKKNRVIAFIPTSSDFARLMAPHDFSAVKVGAAPYFDLPNWNPRGVAAKKLRAGINQARRAGVKIAEETHDLNEQVKNETAKLCVSWLKSRRTATSLGWLVALDPFLHLQHKRYFTARVNGQLVGFLSVSPIPLRHGWYLEDVIRDPAAAPNGMATLLVAEALRILKTEGAALATLGTAPFTTEGPNDVTTENRRLADALHRASARLSGFYNFEGLRQFKSRFVPSWWESEYALHQRGVAMPPRVGHALVRALVPGGLTQLLTRQALKVLREAAREQVVRFR